MFARVLFFFLCAIPASASPETAERLAGEAQSAFGAGDFGKAVDLLTKAIAEDGSNPGLYANRGSSYDYLGKTEEALRDFDTSYRKIVEKTKDPNDKSLAEIAYNRGAVLARAGRFSAAVADFEKTLKLDDDFPDVRTDLAWILATNAEASIRKPEKALEYALEEVNRNGMHSPALGDTLAAAYAANGKFEEAIRQEKEALLNATNISQRKRYTGRLQLYEKKNPYIETESERISLVPVGP